MSRELYSFSESEVVEDDKHLVLRELQTVLDDDYDDLCNDYDDLCDDDYEDNYLDDDNFC